MGTTYHVLFSHWNKKWQLEREDAIGELGNYETQEEAIKASEGVAGENKPSIVLIHNDYGTVDQELTYQ